MRGLPSTGSWYRVAITTISIRNASPVYLKNLETLTVYTNSTNTSNTNIIVNPVMLESTRLTEGAISTTKRIENGKVVFDLKPLNCNAKFNYQVYEYN